MKTEQVIYQHFTRTLAIDAILPVNAYSRFITLLSNTSSIDIRISINNQPMQNLPQGISIELPERDMFKSLHFQNVSGAQCTIVFALSAGRIYDNRVVISGDLDVTDISDDITTPAPITALDKNYLIDNAAAVDKGGGKVGIPVTGHPFETGEIITIANTTNYNETDHVVDADSTANEVVITYAFSAETFDGVDDSIGLTTPRSIAADITQKELIVQNNGDFDIWFGDTNVDAATKRGTALATSDIATISCTAAIYFMSEDAGKTGVTISLNRLQKT